MHKLAVGPSAPADMGRIWQGVAEKINMNPMGGIKMGYKLGRKGYLKLPAQKAPKEYKSPVRTYTQAAKHVQNLPNGEPGIPHKISYMVSDQEIEALREYGKANHIPPQQTEKDIQSLFSQMDTGVSVGYGIGRHPYAAVTGAGVLGTATLWGAGGLMHRPRPRTQGEVPFPQRYLYAGKYYSHPRMVGYEPSYTRGPSASVTTIGYAHKPGDIRKAVRWTKEGIHIFNTAKPRLIPRKIRAGILDIAYKMRKHPKRDKIVEFLGRQNREVGFAVDRSGKARIYRGDAWGTKVPKKLKNELVYGHTHVRNSEVFPSPNDIGLVRGKRMGRSKMHLVLNQSGFTIMKPKRDTVYMGHFQWGKR
jgi:hypothetical protein